MKENLTNLDKGNTATVKGICSGKGARRRLYEMGFNTGARVKILKNDSGPVIVGLSGNKVAVGRGLAEKILIEC